MNSKLITALSLLAVPIAIILVRHFSSAGILVTMILVGLWALQVSIMLLVMKSQRLECSSAESQVKDLMMDDEEGIKKVDAVVRAELPIDQWNAVCEFGQLCFIRGMVAQRLREQGLK